MFEIHEILASYWRKKGEVNYYPVTCYKAGEFRINGYWVTKEELKGWERL